ncbi:putative aquaporin 4 [Amanita rubescens]|nr:putative aquaporin 4 [Amanita rubescens]
MLIIFHVPRLPQQLIIPLTTDTLNTGTEQVLESSTVTTWNFFSEIIREAFAEFLGTAILTGIGIGANCQAVLSSNTLVSSSPKGDWTTVALGWGTGAALAVWACGGISGGHINPAVTLAFATFRGLPWKKVPVYMFSQLLGGIVGASLAYANYFHAITIFEGGGNIRTLKTAGLFAVYPLDYMTNVSAFFSEFLATAVLVIAIFSMCDRQNVGTPKGLGPLVIFMVFVAIAVALGMETSFGINPARDLGPRIVTSMVGYGREVYNFRRQYWLWCQVMAPFLGALGGALVYDFLVYTGTDSPLSKL